jgi:hypothetical protein
LARSGKFFDSARVHFTDVKYRRQWRSWPFLILKFLPNSQPHPSLCVISCFHFSLQSRLLLLFVSTCQSLVNPELLRFNLRAQSKFQNNSCWSASDLPS